MGFRICFSTEIEETWVYVGWRICGTLSGDRGVRRVDGRGRDVLFLPIVVVKRSFHSPHSMVSHFKLIANAQYHRTRPYQGSGHAWNTVDVRPCWKRFRGNVVKDQTTRRSTATFKRTSRAEAQMCALQAARLRTEDAHIRRVVERAHAPELHSRLSWGGPWR